MHLSQRSRRLVQLGILAAVAAAYFGTEPVRIYVKRIIFLFAMADVSAIKGYILSFGLWAPVISFLLMMFQSVMAPLPAFLLTFANAALFGWVRGALLSWSSAMAGAALCFLMGRLYGREVVSRFTSRPALEGVDRFFDRHGQYAVLIARLLPFVSFDVVSYAAGLTSISFWSFFLATGIGQLPATLVYSYVGDMLTGSVRTFVFGLLIIFSLAILLVLLKRMLSERQPG